MPLQLSFTKPDGTQGNYWVVKACSIQEDKNITALYLYKDQAAYDSGKVHMMVVPLDLPPSSADLFAQLVTDLQAYIVEHCNVPNGPNFTLSSVV